MTDSFNFGELVLRADELETTQTKAARKKSCAPVFECVACSGADFVVKRTTATTSRLLVVLVSQEQYYVKDERSGKLDALTEKVLDSFFQGFGEARLQIGCSWLDVFSNSKATREGLMAVASKRGFKAAATSGLFDFNEFVGYHGFNTRQAQRRIAELALAFEKSAPLMRHIAAVVAEAGRSKGKVIAASLDQLMNVHDVYGLDRAREFVSRYATCNALAEGADAWDGQLGHLSDLLSIVPTREGIMTERLRISQLAPGEPVAFQFDKLCDYLFNQSAREGVMSLCHWVSNWKDALLLQLYVSGKIVDKYPENLLTTHQILSTEAARMKRGVDDEKWAAADAAMKDLDYAPKGSRYLITHPATPDAMRSEAVAQSNCLASYIDSVLAGRCMIFFARMASDPEKSLLTIEVNRAGELAQVKARFNREADDDSMRFVAEWCREKGISLGRYARRIPKPTAA